MRTQHVRPRVHPEVLPGRVATWRWVHRKSGHAAAQNFQFGLPQTNSQGTKIGAPIGGSACRYQATFMPSTGLASPGYDGQQPYIYTSPRLR